MKDLSAGDVVGGLSAPTLERQGDAESRGHRSMHDRFECEQHKRIGRAWLTRIHTPEEQKAAADFMFRGFDQATVDSWPTGMIEALIEWKLIVNDLEAAHLHIWAGGSTEAPDHVRTLLAAHERMERVAEAHHKRIDEHGGNWGDCNECGWSWPCPTYEWARPDSERAPLLSPWDPSDDDEGLRSNDDRRTP